MKRSAGYRCGAADSYLIMRILSIDTTTVRGSVALSEGERLVAQEVQGAPGTHSERLMVTIDHLMGLAGWGRDAIEGIAVAIGPGSFTGLRIGLATAKGMALAVGCPVAGVSSLQSLALNGEGFPGTVVSLVDARRGELYAAAYAVRAGKGPKRVMKECVLPPDTLIRKLKAIKGPLLLVGDGALAFEQELRRALGKRAVVPGGATPFPQAINLARLAYRKLRAGKGDDCSALVPNYVRRSDAEIGFLGNAARRNRKAIFR